MNDFGVGERTETVTAQTRGSAPIAPLSSLDLIKVNSSSIVLDLAAWANGGCPITSFVVEYKKQKYFSTSANDDSMEGEDDNKLMLQIGGSRGSYDPLG